MEDVSKARLRAGSILEFLERNDARAQKIGLQRLCALLERTGTSDYRRRIFGKELFDQYDCLDEKVRLWAYKATALLREDRLKPNLISAIQRDKDADARSWAVGALASFDMSSVIVLDRRHDLFADGLQKDISTTFFSYPGRPFDVPAHVHPDMHLSTLRWVLSAYGERRIDIDPQTYSALLRHEDWEIRQYCLWAYVKRGIPAVQRPLTMITLFQEPDPRVIRWHLRALFITPSTNAGQISDAIRAISTETDYVVREGLALGLADSAYHFREVSGAIRTWHQVEPNAVIKDLLLEYLLRFANKDREVFEYLVDMIQFERLSEEVTVQRIISALPANVLGSGRPGPRARLQTIILKRSYHDMSQKVTVQGNNVHGVNINAIAHSPRASISSPEAQTSEIRHLVETVLSDLNAEKRAKITKSIADKARRVSKSSGSTFDAVIDHATKRLSRIGTGVDKIAKIQAGLEKIFTALPFLGVGG